MNLKPVQPGPDPPKASPSVFTGFFSDPNKFKSFLNQKAETINKEEYAGFLKSGESEKKTEKKDDEDIKDDSEEDLGKQTDLPEAETKIVPMQSSPYTKLISVSLNSKR